MSLKLRLRQQWKDEQEQGQSLVEFALVLIFIIIPVTFMLIETSLILYEYVSLTNAAREGVRTGSIYMYVGQPSADLCVTMPNDPCGPDNGREQIVTEAVRGTMGPGIVLPPDCSGTSAATTCQITYGPSTSLPVIGIADPLRSNDAITVTLIYNHQLLFGALGGNIDLQAHANMRIEPSSVISAAGP